MTPDEAREHIRRALLDVEEAGYIVVGHWSGSICITNPDLDQNRYRYIDLGEGGYPPKQPDWRTP